MLIPRREPDEFIVKVLQILQRPSSPKTPERVAPKNFRIVVGTRGKGDHSLGSPFRGDLGPEFLDHSL